MARAIIGGYFLTLRKKTLKVIGIDIGSTMIKMVEVFFADTPKLIKWACVDIPSVNTTASPDHGKEVIGAIKMLSLIHI